MIYWDTSAIVPLLVDEPNSTLVGGLRDADSGIVTWWGTKVECLSAIARQEREGHVDRSIADSLRADLDVLAEAWYEITPTNRVREHAGRLLLRHPLRSADALQLAAALVWARERPKGHRFLSLDSRLYAAAHAEGFLTIPG